jgi:3-deoxy-D-manno-octulosonic-acid transferase
MSSDALSRRWIGRVIWPVNPNRNEERNPAVSYLLNCLYFVLLALASPWLLGQAVRKGKYREGSAAKFLGQVPRREPGRPCIWFHAVSVGEVNLLATLLARIAARRPDCECVISTTTMTGFALARKKYPETTVFYCPLDFTWAVRRALARVRPNLLVLAELELWPNLILLSHAASVKVAIVNGRLSERSFRGYRRGLWLVRPLLERIDFIGAQNQECAERFCALGANPQTVHVTGSIKFDGAQTDRHNPVTERLRALAGFASADIIFLAGSTQDPEESLALAAFRQLAHAHPRLRLVLVPRHPDRFAAVAALLGASGVAWQRRGALDIGPSDPAARVLLVDAVGELGAWWGTADIGFVGGSLSRRGGQNMIEPAAYGAAVSFGPNTRNFRDIVAALLAERAAVVVHDGDELTAFVRRALEDPAFAAKLGQQAKAFVARHLGATERTLAGLLPLVVNERATIPVDRSAA